MPVTRKRQPLANRFCRHGICLSSLWYSAEIMIHGDLGTFAVCGRHVVWGDTGKRERVGCCPSFSYSYVYSVVHSLNTLCNTVCKYEVLESGVRTATTGSGTQASAMYCERSTGHVGIAAKQRRGRPEEPVCVVRDEVKKNKKIKTE